MPTTGANARTRPRALLRALLNPNVLLGVVAPIVAYQCATALGASELVALACGAPFPLAGITVGLVRGRRLDPISAVSLTAIIIGLAAGLLLHNAEFLLLKDSLVSSTIGLAFLGSLTAGRPLVFTIGRARSTEQAAIFDRRWPEPAFQQAMRRLTVVWGVALLAEATARVVLSLLVPPGTLLVVSPFIAAVFLGPVALWTFRRRARMRTP